MPPTKITNVYKQQYINNIGMGIGDFIRGCFFLLQYCNQHNIEFDIDLSHHPISNLLICDKNENNYDNVECFLHMDSYDELKEYLFHKENHHYLFINSHPINKITSEERDLIKNRFIPNEELNRLIENELSNLCLNKNEYTVIHIRVGDLYINNNKEIDNQTYIDIENLLKQNNIHENYLLISDSNELKIKLNKIYPNLKIMNKTTVHLAICQNIEDIQNTMIDFFLLSYAKSIIGLSVYAHLTGFSQYCSIMHNIPYQGIHLHNYLNQ